MADEWTFVSHKAPKQRRNRHNGKGEKHVSNKVQHGSGLYRTSVEGGSKKQHNNVGENNSNGRSRSQTQEEKHPSGERERIKKDILDCLHALENQLRTGNGFAHRLISSMAISTSYMDDNGRDGNYKGNATTKSNDGENNESKVDNSPLHLREIVAYGIGNFATDRFQAPMLQLACVLLLRKCATDSSIHQSTKAAHDDDDGAKLDGGNISDLFEEEQRQVPIYYYEPCILPHEKELLETVFHVHVLECNEMGKVTVESMRQLQETSLNSAESSATATADTEMRTESNGKSAHTLFYMPHCPMRLYCNVLWAHWDHIFQPTPLVEHEEIDFTEFNTSPNNNTDGMLDSNNGNPILIFGNSFQTYQERTISSEKRLDPTNGVFRIVPYAKEISTNSNSTNTSRSGGGGEIIADALRHLEMAFNDCNVISFPIMLSGDSGRVSLDSNREKESSRWPNRPNEWIASQNPESNGELIGR